MNSKPLAQMKFKLKSNVIMHTSQRQRQYKGFPRKESKSLARSRSLKQLFGDLPIIQHHAKRSKVSQEACYNNNPFKTINREGQEKNLMKKKKKQQLIISEYHMQSIQNKKYSGIIKMNDKIYDKKLLKPGQQVKKQQNINESKIKKYNPNVYSWRKSLSKDKQNIKNIKKDSFRSFTPIQSEYYQESCDKRQNNVFKQVQPIKNRQLKIIRSSSQELYLKNKSNLSVRPKVFKNIFGQKSSKFRSLLKKEFLYTFGL